MKGTPLPKDHPERWIPGKRYSWGTPADNLVKNGELLCRDCGGLGGRASDTGGVMICLDCQEAANTRTAGHRWATEPEFYDIHLRNKMQGERRKFFNSQILPTRQGDVSREFVEAYPKKARKMFSEDRIRKAQNVWKDVDGWSTREKSL